MTVVNNALGRIQNILDVEAENLTLLTELTQIQVDILTEKLGGIPVPPSLTFIVVETTIARYRRIGAEGLSDKKADVIQNSYSDDLFKPYEAIIAKHAVYDREQPNRIVRMI